MRTYWAVSLLLVSGMAFAQPGAPGTIDGTVKDGSGSAVAGAIVTLAAADSTAPRTTVTDNEGAFHFAAVAPGTYKVAVASTGFTVWTANVDAGMAGGPQPLSAVLQVAPVSSTMDVTPPPKELAAEQLKTEEKQRVLGVFPHYMVTYDPNPAPLTAGQKFHLGFKTLIDPVTLLGTGIDAGIEQVQNRYPDFGQGVEGYAKLFGARYTNHLSGVMIHHVILQAAFHQDPRYFFKSTGSFSSRFWYSVWTAFVCKGDNGRWQPDYSDVIGGAAASQVSRLYYPSTSRPYLRLWHDVLLGFGGRAEDHLIEQFVLSKVTTHTHRGKGAVEAILKEGTPVSLVSLGDPSAGPIVFVLASDLQADGVTVAKVGALADGQASNVGGQAMQVKLDHVHLKAGNVDVPLRSNQTRGGEGSLQYRQIEGSGRIALVLFVAGDIAISRNR